MMHKMVSAHAEVSLFMAVALIARESFQRKLAAFKGRSFSERFL